MSLLSILSGDIQGEAISGIGGQLGLNEQQTQAAVSAAMPLLIKAMSQNASGGGADALLGALQKDHDGSILDDVPGFMAGGNAAAGAGILKHVLGGKQDVVASGIARAAGLDSGQSAQVLAMLAPVVLGALGKTRSENDFGADDIIGLLNQETQTLESNNPDVMGVLGNLLDTDNDGDIADDLVNIGGKLLSGML